MGRKKKQEIVDENNSVEIDTEQPIEEKSKKKKNKKSKKEDTITFIDEENQSSDSTTDINSSEDLYAPFGDKTFNKDELLDTNNSENSNSNSDMSVNDDIDINRIKNDNEYLEHLDESIIKENLKQKKTPEEQNDFDLQMMKNYMGKNYTIFTNSKFNIYAFLFGGLYLIYRKMYLYGFSIYFFSILLISLFFNNVIVLGIIIALVIGIHVIIGLNFNKLYLTRSFNQIKKIEKKYNANQDDYVLSECKLIGGTNIVHCVIISLVTFLAAMFDAIQIHNFTK